MGARSSPSHGTVLLPQNVSGAASRVAVSALSSRKIMIWFAETFLRSSNPLRAPSAAPCANFVGPWSVSGSQKDPFAQFFFRSSSTQAAFGSAMACRRHQGRRSGASLFDRAAASPLTTTVRPWGERTARGAGSG